MLTMDDVDRLQHSGIYSHEQGSGASEDTTDYTQCPPQYTDGCIGANGKEFSDPNQCPPDWHIQGISPTAADQIQVGEVICMPDNNNCAEGYYPLKVSPNGVVQCMAGSPEDSDPDPDDIWAGGGCHYYFSPCTSACEYPSERMVETVEHAARGAGTTLCPSSGGTGPIDEFVNQAHGEQCQAGDGGCVDPTNPEIVFTGDHDVDCAVTVDPCTSSCEWGSDRHIVITTWPQKHGKNCNDVIDHMRAHGEIPDCGPNQGECQGEPEPRCEDDQHIVDKYNQMYDDYINQPVNPGSLGSTWTEEEWTARHQQFRQQMDDLIVRDQAAAAQCRADHRDNPEAVYLDQRADLAHQATVHSHYQNDKLAYRYGAHGLTDTVDNDGETAEGTPDDAAAKAAACRAQALAWTGPTRMGVQLSPEEMEIRRQAWLDNCEATRLRDIGAVPRPGF